MEPSLVNNVKYRTFQMKVSSVLSLGNPSKGRQWFVDAIVLISALDWSIRLSNFENVVETAFDSAFECRTMPSFAKLVL